MPTHSIPDPIHGDINVRAIAGIVNHPVMLGLQQKSQLGGLNQVFQGGNHRRFGHSLGTYAVGSDRIRHAAVCISDEIGDAPLYMLAYLVLHDVGHRAFSHLSEPLVGDHKEHGAHIIRERLAGTIHGMGLNPELLATILTGGGTVGKAIWEMVHNFPLGADILDYLPRDLHFARGERLDLRKWYTELTGWDELGLFLRPRGLMEINTLLTAYWTQYANIYERPSGRTAERYLQELIRRVLLANGHFRKLIDEEGEDVLMGAIHAWCSRHSSHEASRRLEHWSNRSYPRKTWIYSSRPGLAPVEADGEALYLPWDMGHIDRSSSWELEQLELAEARVAEAVGLKPWEVSVSPAPPAKRWRVPDLRVEQADHRFTTLVAQWPSLRHVVADYAAGARTVIVSLDEEARTKYYDDLAAQCAVQQILEAV